MQEQQQTPRNSEEPERPARIDREKTHNGDKTPQRPPGGGRGGNYKVALIVGAIVLLAAIAQPFAKFILSFTSNTAPQAQYTGASLKLADTDYAAMGLPIGATYQQQWEKADAQSQPEFNVCAAGATTFVTHGLIGNDAVSVNGLTVTAAQNGNTGLIKLPLGTNEVQVTGLQSHNGKQVMIVLDGLPNSRLSSITNERNSCELQQCHCVALKIGETKTIPVSHRF